MKNRLKKTKKGNFEILTFVHLSKIKGGEGPGGNGDNGQGQNGGTKKED